MKFKKIFTKRDKNHRKSNFLGVTLNLMHRLMIKSWSDHLAQNGPIFSMFDNFFCVIYPDFLPDNLNTDFNVSLKASFIRVFLLTTALAFLKLLDLTSSSTLISWSLLGIEIKLAFCIRHGLNHLCTNCENHQFCTRPARSTLEFNVCFWKFLVKLSKVSAIFGRVHSMQLH